MGNILKIIPNKEKDKEGIYPKKKDGFNFCNHTLVLVCEHKRTLRCDKCEKYFDPFDYLMAIANKNANEHRDYIYWESKKKELFKALDEAQRLEKNTRARLKTLEKKIKKLDK